MTPIPSESQSIFQKINSSFIHSQVIGIFRVMRTSHLIQHISAGISLTVLAFGFILLGLLAMINRRQGEMAGATALENNYCIIGSIISIFAGAIFLIAGWAYWIRWPVVVATSHQEEQVKPR